MTKAILVAAASAIVGVVAVAAGYYAARPALAVAEQEPIVVAAPVDGQRQEVEQIVRDYLLKNPEIMVEVQAALETKQKEAQRLASLATIQSSKAEIYNSAGDGVVGNPNGKTTIVEFYDYNCGYCKRAITDMQTMISSDPDLRFVLKELPILGPDSQKAHVVAQAFKHLMPEKYGEFHTRLLGGESRATEETAILVATSLGVDEAKLREEMKSPEIQKLFQATYELAEKLSITGTPSYVVGDEVVFGALGAQVLTEKVAAARATCQTAAC